MIFFGMKCVIQRVTSSSVSVDGRIVGEIQKGFLILLGVAEGDTDADAEKLAKKISLMRVFEDNEGKMNLSVKDIGGEILVVSQFTLCSDCKKGNRPSFVGAMRPEGATRLYELFMALLKDYGVKRVAHGIFGADMKVSLVNDGPVTIILDTEML